MRAIAAVTFCALLGACTTGPVTVPRDQVLYEVPPPQVQRAPATAIPPQRMGSAVPPAPQVATSAQDDFTGRIARVLDEDGAPERFDLPDTSIVAERPGISPPGEGGFDAPLVAVPNLPSQQATPLDDDRLNLNEYTLEQQRIDAAIAERQLAEARSQLVIVQPDGTVPEAVQGVNIALFAKQTTHAVGERRYSRPVTARLGRATGCRRFATTDDAQRFFLASGGPERDPHGLDPEGDGFACGWDPEPYRRLRL